jgi:hypothetical protein
LIGYQSGLRNYDSFLRISGLDHDSHQLAVNEAGPRIGHGGTRCNRVGRAINGHIDKIQVANLVIHCAVRVSEFDFQAIYIGPFASLLRAQKIALADGECHVHRILAYNRRQRACAGADDVPLCDAGAADFPGNG